MSCFIYKLYALSTALLVSLAAFSKTIYVSSSQGDNANPGTSVSPVRTIEYAIQKADTVRLKAGDVFFESLKINKRYIGRYGEGPNPTVCGYRRLTNPNWKQVAPNIWKISLIEDNYSGYDVQGPSLLNNIGCIHEYDRDLVHGRKVKLYSQLEQDWDLWQTDVHSSSMDPACFNDVYLYYTGNPNNLQLEFAVGCIALQIRYSTIENIKVEGFGFGISVLLGDCVVRNCRIDAIGGKILLSQSTYALEGNGISLYFGDYSVKNCLIEGNYISRCYDCGLCVQGTGNKGSNASNIIIQDNLVTNCCQGLENFSGSTTVQFDNCIAKNNLFVSNGESGFGYPKDRFKHCQILENNTRGPKGFQYVDNVFIDGNFYCVAPYEKTDYKSSVFSGNEVYLAPNQFIISDYYGKRDVIRSFGNGLFNRSRNNDQVSIYGGMTDDWSTSFRVLSQNRIDRLSRKLMNEFFERHSY